MARLSDSELAFRLQMEEAISASLSSRSSAAPPRSSSPIVHSCGVAIVMSGDRRSSTAENRGGEPPNGGGRNEKPHGKGIIYEKATGVRGDDRRTRCKNGIYRNFAGCGNTGKPSPAIRLPQGFVRQADSSGEGCSGSQFKDNQIYRLYFKGLVSEETGDDKNSALLAGYGVAICDMSDNLWFEMKGPLYNTDRSRQAAEIRALMGGLEEAIGLGIKRIAIYCDYYPIYQYLSGRWMPKQKKIALLMDDLHRLRLQLIFSKPVLVTRNDIKFAFKLARDAIGCQTRTSEGTLSVKAARKETCVICFNDTDTERMFSVDECLHRYCFSCVNQYVEVKLLHGIIPKCPHDGCKSVLSIDGCGKILTPKLVAIWKRRIKEDSIPVINKVYCPYPKCSALMSKTDLSTSFDSFLSVRPNSSGLRRCTECHGFFCINCKVPWHDNLSCTDYKKLHPDPPADVKLKSLANLNKWRQCVQCHHMIELSQGCYHMTCRCGYQFCYNCGSDWDVRENRCDSSCPLWSEDNLTRRNAANYADWDDDEDHYNGGGHNDYEYYLIQYLNRGLNEEGAFNNPERWLGLEDYPELVLPGDREDELSEGGGGEESWGFTRAVLHAPGNVTEGDPSAAGGFRWEQDDFWLIDNHYKEAWDLYDSDTDAW